MLFQVLCGFEPVFYTTHPNEEPYYYDSKQKTCFIFAYKKIKGKVKEYRAYYGADGKLYRYIGPSGKIKDYKKGKDLTDSSKLVSKLYYASLMHLHYVL